MSCGLRSIDWTWWGKFTVVLLLIAVTGAGLVFVFSPIFDLGWIGEAPSDKVSFYVTGVGVPLLTFAGFLAVLLGFLAQQEQNTQQEEHFQKDRFENAFFELLKTYNQIAQDIGCEEQRPAEYGKFGREPEKWETIQVKGRSCFEMIYISFKREFERKFNEENWKEFDVSEKSKIKWVYENWFSKRKAELNHYFYNLSRLISFVYDSRVEDKKFYVEMIASQMSVPERNLFFYHVSLMKDESHHRHLREVHEALGEYTFFDQIDPHRSLIHKEHADLHPEALGIHR